MLLPLQLKYVTTASHMYYVILYAVDISVLRKSTDRNDARGNILVYWNHSPGRMKLTENQSQSRSGVAYVLGHKTNRDIYPWINFVLYDALALNKTIINYLLCNCGL